MTYTMFDSVNAADFPASGFDATAGYVAGRYPSSAPIRARFPTLPHLTIAVTARQDAQCLDVEPGDATPAEAPGWFDRQRSRGIVKPVIYTMRSLVDQVRATMGGRNYLLWVAHPDFGSAHICGPGTCGKTQADGTQWLFKGPRGENVDQSVISDVFYWAIGGTEPPTPPPPSIVAIGIPTLMAAAGNMAINA